jgi:hypothetical protein
MNETTIFEIKFKNIHWNYRCVMPDGLSVPEFLDLHVHVLQQYLKFLYLSIIHNIP